MNILSIFNQAFQLHQAGKVKDAMALYLKILPKQQKNTQLLYALGTAYYQLGQLKKSIEYLRKSIAINSKNASAHNNLGNALRDYKQLDEALVSYEKAIKLKSDFVSAYINLGNALRDSKRLDEAITSYEKALALNPSSAEAYNNLGNTLQDMRHFNEALDRYQKAITLKPDYADAYWNQSLVLLLSGQYLEGWELFEWRIKKEDLKHHYYNYPPPKIAWRGKQHIEDKKILIHSEQGFGDVIQFCRFLPQLKSLGAEIIFEVPQPVLSIVSTLNCDMTVIAKGSAQPEFDAYCPLMSLPHVFKTTVETIPNRMPYLFSDSVQLTNWQHKLGRSNQLRVGLVWSGSTTHKNDLNRSIRLEKLLSLKELPVEFHSLQREYSLQDHELLKDHPNIQQHQSDLNDFSDTAALIECMDLVISVDTSVAHLAGAIGKPVWILLPFVPDFRWLLEREDSPWYPTARLFRQPMYDDWDSVIQSVVESLKRLIEV